MPRLKQGFIIDRFEARQMRRWWVAEQLGISRRTLLRWLNGVTAEISSVAAEKLAEILSCSVQEIIHSTDSDIATSEEQSEAARALVASDLLASMAPGHQYALYTKLAKGMLVPGLGKQELGALYMNLSLAHFRQSQLDDAGHYANKTKQLALELGDRQLLLRANMQLSYQAYLKGDAAQCLKLELDNLELAKVLGDKKLIAANLSNIGDQHLNFGDHERSLLFQLESISLYESLYQEGADTESNLTFCHLGLVSLYLEQALYVSAAEHITHARRWAERGKFRRGLADCDRFEALLASATGHTGKTLVLMRQSEQIYNELNIMEVPILIDFGLISHRLKRDGPEFLERAVKLAKDRNSILLEAFAKKALVELGCDEHRTFATQVFQQAGLHHQIKLMDMKT